MKRRMGEDDSTPDIAAAAFTVTLSSEGSAGRSVPTGPTRSGSSVEAQPHSVAQEVEPEAQESDHPFLLHLRAALTGATAARWRPSAARALPTSPLTRLRAVLRVSRPQTFAPARRRC